MSIPDVNLHFFRMLLDDPMNDPFEQNKKKIIKRKQENGEPIFDAEDKERDNGSIGTRVLTGADDYGKESKEKIQEIIKRERLNQ